MNQRRAMSLIETLFAVFVLLAAFTIFGTLFQWVMTSSKRGDQAATAARLAHNRLQEVRQWAAQPSVSSDNFRAGSWGTWATPLEVEPGYTVRVDRVANQCYSPSSSLEAGYARPREMSNACRRVRVRVHWGQQDYDVYSQLAAPAVNPLKPYASNIVITQGFSGSLAYGSAGILTAQARDDQNQNIDDLVYEWTVLPESGTASLTEVDRNGRQIQVNNNNPLTTSGNTLKVSVSATYRGIALAGSSGTITLGGP